jgi:hypothetical protein
LIVPSTCSRLASVVIQTFQFIGLSYTVSIPTVIPRLFIFSTISIPFNFLHHTIPCNINAQFCYPNHFFFFLGLIFLLGWVPENLNSFLRKLAFCAKFTRKPLELSYTPYCARSTTIAATDSFTDLFL